MRAWSSATASSGRELRGGVVELGEVLDDLVEGGELVLELAGVGEGLEILIGVRDGRLAHFDRIGLFRRNGEVPVLLEGLLGILPPFLEFRFAENLRGQSLGDLILRGLAAEARENGAHEADWIVLRRGPSPRRASAAFWARMCSLGDRLERLGGVLELHRVALLGLEIDGHLADQKIQRIDLPEAPAFVEDVGAGLKLIEDLASRGGEFAGVDRLLDFGMHGLAKIGVGRGMAKKYLGRTSNSPHRTLDTPWRQRAARASSSIGCWMLDVSAWHVLH